MALKNIDYKEDYRTGYNDLVKDFYQPSLMNSKLYWRAVGYFSSTALETFGSPLGTFVKNGGCVRLVTSVELSESDLLAIDKGSSKLEVCSKRIEQIIDEDFAEGAGDGTIRLTTLLQLGRLEIKIAVPKKGTGIYHEKIGLFFDGNEFVAFTGSSNESRNALENNRECIDVFPSWSSSKRANRKLEHFKELWECNDHGVRVFDFPDAAKKKLLRIRRREEYSQSPIPIEKKWRHQDKALAQFLKSERGILNMATGTGKTRTALKIMNVLFDNDDIDTVIVSTEGTNLLQQWYRETLSCAHEMQRGLRIYRHFHNCRELQDFLLHPDSALLLTSRKPLASTLRNLPEHQARRTLLIHDEVHGLGSAGNREKLKGLSDNIRFRLGLSATPERAYDEEGNQFILHHIGPEIMNFGLTKAIQRGILAPFDYYPLGFDLADDEKSRLYSLLARLQILKEENENSKDVRDQLIQIARVYKLSESKLPIFAKFIESRTNLLDRCIIFTETKNFGNAVLNIVHKHSPNFHTYFDDDQLEVFEKFARGDINCLITCHRLSEGIDIKSLNSVILFASDKGRLETIQRIGRCLRTNPDDPSKIAKIVDFIYDRDEVQFGRSTSEQPLHADVERKNWLTELAKTRMRN